jgi:phenylacetate-CoA ligase
MYTTACMRQVAAKGYPLTVVTPGNNKAEILRVIAALAPSFEQLVLCGYPPFLKDVIDAGRADGFDWSRKPVRLVLAGEVFSEEWRDIVCDRLGQRAPELATASLYGTADGGVLACETPFSIRLRRAIASDPALTRDVFGEARLPTLCQYDPLHRYFELAGNELLFSADGGAPLIRYKILDRGGLISFRDANARVQQASGRDIAGELRGEGVTVREQPLVHVFGRTNFALSFYGANVYPENVALGIERPELMTQLSGKFVLQISPDKDENPVLDLAVELLPKVEPTSELERDIARSVQAALERVNSEFLAYAPSERRKPRVRLFAHGDPAYFPLGVKHRYTRH